jgi:outer membrane protein
LTNLLYLLPFQLIVLYSLHKKTVLFAAAIFFCCTLSAQNDSNMVIGQPWSLSQCISYAWKHNLSIKQSEVSRDIAKNNVTGSKANIFPNVNGYASNTYNFGRTIDPFTNTFASSEVLSQDFYVSSSFTIFGGEQNLNTVKQNQASYEASRYDVEVSKNNIALNIASGYLQVLLDQELLEEAKNQHEVTLQQVERTQNLVTAGSLARSNLLDVQAQEANDDVNQINAQNQLDLAMLSLAQLLDVDSVQLFKIAKPDIQIPANAVIDGPEQVYYKALTSMPDIHSAEMKWKSSEDAKQVAEGGLFPKLTLNGTIGTGYSGANKQTSTVYNNDTLGYVGTSPIVAKVPTTQEGGVTPWAKQLNDNFNKSIGFRLNIPIFNGLQSNMAYRNAKLNALNNYYNYESSEINLRKNIQQAYADALGALKKYHATEKAVTSLQEAFNYTKTKFDVGMSTALDYNTAKTNLTKAESDLLQAKYNYIFKVKVLDYYEGKPLKL